MRHDLTPAADIVDLVATTTGKSLVVVVESGRDDLALARTLAAVGPLARRQAPARRINLVVAGEGADPRAVDAAARFLDGAASTTGQVITIS